MTETQELVGAVVRGIQEKKGFDIVTIDLSGIVTAPAKYFVVATGNSPQQVDAVVESVWDTAFTELGEKTSSVTGQGLSEWVVMDYGTVVVHVFVPMQRDYYDIEHLYEDGTMNMIPNID